MDEDLVRASQTGDIYSVKRLLDAGADVNAKNKYGYNSLILASQYHHTEIVKLLLERGADVNAQAPLAVASGEGYRGIIKLLLDAGADVNARDNDGATSLMYASRKNQIYIVKLLLMKGADVNAKDSDGRNSLMMVSSESEGDVNIAKVLVQNDIFVNEQDNDGNTALIEASLSGNTDIVEFLIEDEIADVNTENKNGVTPLIAASPGGYTDIVKRLLDAGADVNTKEIRGKTPLMFASGASKLYVVKLLLERGADVNMKDNDNNTALDLASNGKIKMLLNNALGKQELWKGMTRSDISQLDSIFGEGASNHSICPICLQYAERVDGCMYMTHNCTKHGNEYHEGLYNIYKNNDGFIDWCTICNRIAKGHNHFKLADVNTTTPSVIVEPGDPFEDDCSLSSGGGGPMEKLARFRRFREYALDLQDDIGKKSKEQAFEELVEEVWNAPIRREGRLLKEIKNKKNWNISSSKFPLPIATENVAYPNIPYNGPLPTKINSGRNNIGMNNNVPILKFVHQQPDGSEKTHGISEENLEGFIQSVIGGFGGEERSGYCFMYPGCKARLYPQEVKDYIPDELYNIYKKNFNQKFKTASGGGSEDLIQEANDFMCVNPKRGGRRNTRKRRQTRKKNKKTKSRRL